MTPRFPLFGKITGWLLLNLALLAGLAWFVVQHQVHFGFDSLLAGGAGDRVRSLAEIAMQDLNEHPREEWDAVLAKLERAYPVHIFLFSNRGEQLAGTHVGLPTKIQQRLRQMQNAPRPGPPPQRPPRPEERPGERPPFEEGPPGMPRRDRPPLPAGPREPVIGAFLKNADQYYILMHAPLDPAHRVGPTALVFVSDTLSAGGLIFDYAPLLWGAAAALALSILFWLPLVRGITRSIADMRSATARIAEGQFDVRVDARRRDELGSLGAAINSMSERLAGLVNGQRRFLSDVAHELCAPLSRLQMALGILEQRSTDADSTRLSDVREEVDHMAGLVNELLSFSRATIGSTKARLQAVPVRELILETARREAINGAKIEIVCDSPLAVQADPDLLQRALGNLLRNALHYAEHAGPITVTGDSERADVIITVTDHGPGVPEEFLPQLFDPFFRVDSSRTRETGGVGLGLTITKTCVEACGGTIAVQNNPPSGLRVSIRLPRAT